MAFRKKTQIVGLDIGSRTLKMGLIQDTKKVSILKKFGTMDIEAGMIEDGLIKNPDEVADTIKRLFKLFKVKDQNVAISIGGYSIIVKTITVQTMEEAKLQETIHFEAEQYIPFDISDVNLDFQILGENDLNPNQMDVLLVAAKKDVINDYVNLVQMADLNPCIIDVDAFALQNIYETNYNTEGQNVALIDIGANKTALNILKGTFSVFMRDVSLGCSQINERIVSALGCSVEEAEQMYNNEKKDKNVGKDTSEIIISVVSEWSAEIRRALDFFYSTYPDDQIGKIILSGGGANIEQFRQLLAQETSTGVETIKPFENLTIDSSFEPAYLEKVSPQAAICMGLALRRIDDK